MLNHHHQYIFVSLILFLIGLTSCGKKIYNQNILFKTDGSIKPAKMEGVLLNTKQNYIIQSNDFISLQIYSNEGEFLVEPPPPAGLDGNAGNIQFQNNNIQNTQSYLIRKDGLAFLPLIGEIKLAGYTLKQADSLLSKLYSKYYKDSFVRTQYLNKRVFLLKGTSGQVIPLANENTSLIEVLAIGGGVDNNTRASNIRLIRGDLSDPYVEVIDLTTIEGMKQANLILQPNDIIYLEPIRKTFIERISDISPILSFVTTVLTLVTLIITR